LGNSVLFFEIGVNDNLNKSADQNFKIKTYFGFVDSSINVLNHRFEDFSNTVKQFECLDPKQYFSEKNTNKKSIGELKKTF